MSPVGFATKTRTASSALCWLVALAFGLSAASARPRQQGAAAQHKDDTVELSSRLVNIDVMVKDKKGNYVTDLKAEDFSVVENGVPQQIEFLDPPS